MADVQRKNETYLIMVVIATPKLAEMAAELLSSNSIPIQYRFNAEGTASSEVMDMLGFGSVDKSVLAVMLPRPLGNVFLKKLHSELKLDTINSGIAFTISLTGTSNLMIHLLSLLTKKNLSGTGKGGNMIMDPDVRYALVVAAVNRGFSGDVMVAAKTAGAGGGTVIHSRGIEDERVSALCGTAGDEEKEIVLIISEAEKKLGIMQSISENCGMKTDAKGIVISLPIETVMGI